MFIAKFTQVNADSTKFEADKNGNMPFIGELLAGKSRGTLYNGTMFEQNNLKPNTLYVCENIDEEYEGKPQVRVQIISEISVMEFIALKKEPEFKVTKLEIADKAEVDTEEPAFEA